MSCIKEMEIIGFKKFREFHIEFNEKINILVGENEAGKSTILEAINIALNQFYKNVDKNMIKDLVNIDNVNEFKKDPKIETLPKIKIEITLKLDDDCINKCEYFGENNLEGSGKAKYGILFECHFDKEAYGEILENKISEGEIPYEYYTMVWTTFQGSAYKVMKKPLKSIIVDTSTLDSSNSFNYYNKMLFNSVCDDIEKLKVKNEVRVGLNRIIKDNVGEFDQNRYFGVNNKKIIFESIISVFENDIPLENKGKGMENIIKTEIALEKSKTKLDLVMIEEPENHLCHSNLMKMLKKIEKIIGDNQIIITTHSNLIASRLDLKNVIWINDKTAKSLKKIDSKVADYFKKVENNNFLQLLLAEKIILVEGATEYLLLPSIYKKIINSEIEEDKIIIIPCNGISYKNYLKIGEETNKKIAVITDNDENQSKIEEMIKFNQENNNQHIFMDNNTNNWTWEVCLYNLNKKKMESIIKVRRGAKYSFKRKSYSDETILGKMLNHKVETAYEILISGIDIEIPKYVKDAIKWIKN